MCILGANFGPYRTEDFLTHFETVFSQCDDVCFRDSASLALFSRTPSCRVAPDLVFQMDAVPANKTKSIAISIRNMAAKGAQSAFYEPYQRKMAEVIHMGIDRGYQVNLLAFCRHENDPVAVADLLNRMESSEREHVRCFTYLDDMDEILSVMASAERIVAARFHAMVLGLSLNIPTYPIAYSGKMIDTMKEIGYTGPFAQVSEIAGLDPEAVFGLSNDNRLDVASLKVSAERHFEKLDAFLRHA